MIFIANSWMSVYGVEVSISWEFWQNISGWKFVVGVPFFMIYCFGRKFQILVSVKMNLWWTFYYFLKNLTWKNVKNVGAFKWIFQNIDLSMELFSKLFADGNMKWTAGGWWRWDGLQWEILSQISQVAHNSPATKSYHHHHLQT